MFGFIITVHVIACALLILIVLVQQGRGGGLIDSLSSAESIFGTKTNTFLVKSTSILAVIFFITCLGLAFLSIQKSKSLIETSYKPSEVTQQAPAATTVETAQQVATQVPETQQAEAPAQAPTPVLPQAPAQQPSQTNPAP
ncbi:MAG TPA: preprotein translocase subunit SecG [Candidatus Omnitrophica bacterium]|nr:preprotein translocase subunit SecG [Candidatus Omnitrophota bacterium]